MKKIILLLSLTLLATISFSQKTTTTTTKGAIITLDKTVHDYGTIKKNANGVCYFTIINTGTEPLTITNAKGSCGCTVPDWPKEAIAPGDSAKMKVSYATNRVGGINKNVTITSNATNSPRKVVRIIGKVLPPDPKDGAPILKKASPMMKN